MPESAGLQQETAAPGEQLPTLLFKPGFIPVPELNIPSGSCLCSAAPFAAGNCLLSAAVGSAHLLLIHSLNVREGSNPFAHMCSSTGVGWS